MHRKLAEAIKDSLFSTGRKPEKGQIKATIRSILASGAGGSPKFTNYADATGGRRRQEEPARSEIKTIPELNKAVKGLRGEVKVQEQVVEKVKVQEQLVGKEEFGVTEDEETMMVGESEREKIFEEVKLRNMRGMRVEEIVQQGYVMGEGGKEEVIPFPKRVLRCKEFWRNEMHASEEEMKFIEEGYYPEFIEGIEPARSARVSGYQRRMRVDTRWR